MGLEVIGAGFGRTGTLSVKSALETLGFGPCHHMKEVFVSATQHAAWSAAARGHAVDWDVVLDGYRSAVDWPTTNYWRELAERYPEAKVLVTQRPVDDWIRSMQATIVRLIPNRHQLSSATVREVLETADLLVTQQTFHGRLDDRATLRQVYEQRLEDVRETVPAERVLFFDVRDGWSPLCEFLGVPIPGQPFPRSNDKDEFWSTFGEGEPL